MATLATHFRKEDAVMYGEGVPVVPPRRPAMRTVADPYRLRSLPNEDVYFFSKRIDNSRLLREKDPRAPRQCWSTIGAVAVLAILLTCALAPSVWGTFSGYQLQALRQERQHLIDERSTLEVQEAVLVSPGRLERLARAQKLLDPAANQIVHLDPASDGSLAMNLPK